jgi:ABC-type Fe3+/spermidine/putrescine transport system ATPase subunit
MTPDLQLVGLGKAYGATRAVQDVHLSLAKGEMVALLGPSGCGKTTTLRMVAGFVAPTEGRILLDGADITDAPANRRDAGMVFQSYALFPHMSVARNVAFGLRCRRLPEAEVTARTAQALELVGLAALAGRYPRQLSGGQQQRVALARVLVLRPKLLLFDEPLSNLDAKLRVQMRQEIRRLQQSVGITALFVTHDQDEASTIADRIAVMNQGRIEQVGTPAGIYNEPASRFVADFIGTANLIDGVVQAAAAGQLVLRADAGGTFPAHGAARVGARGAITVRPEKIDLVPAGSEHAHSGRIVRAVRIGGLMDYAVHLDNGPELVVHEQQRHGVAARETGALVGVVLRAEHCRFLDD